MQADSLPAKPPGKPENMGVGSLSLLQWIFPTQESNWGLQHCRQILYQLSYQGSKTKGKDGLNISKSYIEISVYALGFPNSSVGKESACNAGDPSLIPGLGRSTGEGIGYPLQYSWASLVAQLVKNLPTKQETWV